MSLVETILAIREAMTDKDFKDAMTKAAAICAMYENIDQIPLEYDDLRMIKSHVRENYNKLNTCFEFKKENLQ